MRIRIHRSDGRTGTYTQDAPDRAAVLQKRLDPEHIFSSGPIVIGVHNPFSMLNPDEICWIEVETDLPLQKPLPADIDHVRKLSGRVEYESLLAKQWPRWMKFRKGRKGDPLEALIELSMRGGESLFLHVTGSVSETDLVKEIFGVPSIAVSNPQTGAVYINPKCIVRARVYHSRDRINFPSGLWVAEADDI